MTTYSIDLDDVDLALLPLRTRYNDFLKKELYQFEVMKTDVVEEPEPTILYTCHICAIEVPAAFACEHTASIKHRANARIASVAAQRTRALITALPPPAAASTARFCANCATTVGKNHEKTKEHRVSVMHDKMLWELMAAYVGDDDVSNYDSEDSDTDLSIKGLKDCNGFGTWDVNGKEETQNKCDRTLKNIETTNKEKNTKETSEENQYKEKKDMDNKTKMSETDKIESGSNGERTDLSIKGLKDCNVFGTWDVNGKEETQNKCDRTLKNIETTNKEQNTKETTEENQYKDKKDIDNKTKMSETDKIESGRNGERTDSISKNRETEIRTGTETETKKEDIPTSSKPKAAEIKIEHVEFVTRDNKLVKVLSDHYHSFVRKVDTINCIVCTSVFKNEEVNSHIFSLKHLNKMPSTLIDEHCVRQINEVYSHCILCNQLVKNSNVTKHHLTFIHGQREKQAVTDQTTTSKIDKTANINVASSANLAIAKATVKAAGVNGGVKALKAPKIEAKTSIDWPVIYPYEMTKQDITVRCVICDCQVPNNPDNRKSHLVGLNHAKNVKNKRVSYDYESDSEYSYQDAEEPNDVWCVECGGNRRFNSPYNLNDSVSCQWNETYPAIGRISSKKMIRKVTYENYEATEDRNAVLCVICGTRVVNSPYHLREHLNGVLHACHEENIRKEKRRVS